MNAMVHHPVFARLYPRMAAALDHAGMAAHRTELLAGLTGEVVEIGAGSGANFPHYPTTVTRVLAVEPEPHLREIARKAAQDAPVPVEVVDGLAEDLPVKDSAADAVVCALVLCSIPDQETALREIRRVIVPGGQFRFLEHVRADTPAMIRVQRFMDATFWPRIAGGCHLGRDTTTAIEHAGFTVERLDRFRVPDMRSPASGHVLGIAVR